MNNLSAAEPIQIVLTAGDYLLMSSIAKEFLKNSKMIG
jgi:hypothetical protein